MFRRVLVALDASEDSRIAGDYAIALARRFGAELTALHVTDLRIVEGPTVETLTPLWGEIAETAFRPEVLRAFREHGQEVLREFARRAGDGGLPAITRQEVGIVTTVILELLPAHDLLVLGRRGEHAAFGDDPLGATAQRILRRAPRPLILTPKKLTEMTQPLVAFDESVPATRALELAARFAEALGLSVHVAFVGELEEGARALRIAGEYLDGHRIPHQLHHRSGDVGTSIAEIARIVNADALFSGAYGHSRLHELFMGSTTSALLRHLELPLFMTR
ncbi:MAG: universal stress protein [Gemmatimonadetes bacterium]|nr:universal stress protein [Gemmatimonadota bacterium]